MNTDAFRIDTDFHLPHVAVADLVPRLDEYWQRQIVDREIHATPFNLSSYPPKAPLSFNPAYEGMSISDALDHFGSDIAIGTVLHGVVALHNPDMRAVLLSALNDHIAATWLDTDQRLRGSICVSADDPAGAAIEIERLAPDNRFVQVIMLAGQEMHHGNRHYWPIYEAAEKHGLVIAVHAGSLYRNAPSVIGWPSFQFEDYVMQSGIFENILLGYLGEGVFTKFPKLNFVFLESGFSWLPTTIWRMDKTWRGVRQEVPWLDRKPSEIIKDRVFFGLQPVDVPGPEELERVLRHIGRDDMLLWSTDYPHRQFENDPLPEGFPQDGLSGLYAGNALRAYPRLGADPAIPDALRKEEVPA